MEALVTYYRHQGLSEETSLERAHEDLSDPSWTSGLSPSWERQKLVYSSSNSQEVPCARLGEIGLVLSPFLVLPLLVVGGLSLSWLLSLTLGLAALWALVRGVRDREVSRVVIVGLLAPVTCLASLGGTLGVLWIWGEWLMGHAGAGLIGSLLFIGGSVLAPLSFSVLPALVTSFLSRRDPHEARFFLYYQALLPIAFLPFLLFSPAGFGLWIFLTVAIWFLGAFHFLTGDAQAREGISRMMRAWLSLGLAMHGFLILVGFGMGQGLWSALAALAVYGPLLAMDRSLGRGSLSNHMTRLELSAFQDIDRAVSERVCWFDTDSEKI